ncbi:MAG: polysaccharide biosynthesis protein, partial [Betaproteobacteria bacterium]
MRSNTAPDPRALLAILHDVLAVAFAWALGFWLRFNLEIPAGYASVMLRTLPIVLLVQAAIFWRFGLYRGIWRYASLHDLRQILIAV